MTVKPTSPCDESRLEVILRAEEDSDEFRAAVGHVDSCEVCQQRLTEMAADISDWKEVRDLLSGDDVMPLWKADQSTQPSSAHSDTTDRLQPDAPWTTSRAKLDFLAPASHPELLGRLGRYEIERVIGTGGMGIVLKGFDTELNRPVAVKVLAPHLAHSGAARQRFAREGRAAAAVVHEHVVAIHNVESEGEVPFLVMQYVAGESLQTRVDRQGPLGIREMLRIAIQAAGGLAAAHEQGLVHRDIKPANLLLEPSVERALLSDFGLARAMDDASLTHTGVVAGTPHYMSPEQADGRSVDHRSDLFSLGAVLYFMAAGRPPFRAERPMAVLHKICHERHRPVREVNPDVPGQLSAVIDRLLEKKPQRRPGNAAELQQELAKLLSDLQQGRLRTRSALRSRSVFRIAGSIAAVGVAIAVIAWAATWLRRTEPKPTDSNAKIEPREDTATYAGDFVSGLLSIGPNTEAEFTAAAGQIGSDLNRQEFFSDSKELYLQEMHSPWYRDSQAVRDAIGQLEQTPYLDSALQGVNQ